MFGRRRREAAFLEAVRNAFAEVVDDAVARLDARLIQGLVEQERMQSVSDVMVQHLRSTVVDTKHDVDRTVEQLTHVCSGLSDRVDAAQRLLIDTMIELAQRSAVGTPVAGERVVDVSFPRQNRVS
jgi:hypothetical protein